METKSKFWKKTSSNDIFFISQNNLKFWYWFSAEMIQFMERAVNAV